MCHAEPLRPLGMHLSSHSPHVCDSECGVSAYTNGLTDLVIDVNGFQRA